MNVTEVIVSNTQIDHIGKIRSQTMISFKHHRVQIDMDIIGTRVANPLREIEVEPLRIQSQSRARSSPQDVTRQIVLQAVLATLTAKDARKPNCFMISVRSAPTIDNGFYKHQAMPLSVSGRQRVEGSLQVRAENISSWVLNTKVTEPSVNQNMPVISRANLMFVDIVIYSSLKLGSGLSLKALDQPRNGQLRDLPTPRAKITIVGRAEINTER